MAEMSMNRVIHAAVRRDLDRFADALRTVRPGDTERAEGLARAWDNFDHQLTGHHESEHAIVWPALQSIGVSQALTAEMDSEHAAMAAALSQARRAMDAFVTNGNDAIRQAALTAVEHLREVTVTHLDHEEREMETLFLAHRDSATIKAMNKKLQREGGLVEGGVFLAWVLDGCGPEERAAIEGEIPKPVLAILTGLFGRGYRKNIAPVWAT